MRLRFDRPWQWLCCLAVCVVPVLAAPCISQAPVSQGVAKGDSVTLSVAATGTGTLSYQWSHAVLGQALATLSGKTSASLPVSVNAASDLGVYEVAVTDSTGTVKATALLQPALALGGAVAPASVVLQSGGGTTLTAQVQGGQGSLSYQWRCNGGALSGARSASLSLSGLQRSDAGYYDVQVTDDFRTVTLAGAWVGVGPQKSIDVYAEDKSFAPRFEIEGEGYGQGLLLSSGRMLVSGGFSRLGAQAAPGVACFNADGSLDTGFKRGRGIYTVFLAELAGGKILVLEDTGCCRYAADGSFEADLNGSLPPGWIPNWATRGRDGSLYVVCTKANAVDRTIFRFTSGFVPDPTFVSPVFTSRDSSSLSVLPVLETADGHLMVAGGFSALSGGTMANVARLNHDGSLDTSYGAGTGFDQPVMTMTLAPDGSVLLGGYFNSFSGSPAKCFARLEGAGVLSASWAASASFDGMVQHLGALPDGRVVVAGSFNKVGASSVPAVAVLKADGSVDLTASATLRSGIGDIDSLTMNGAGRFLATSSRNSRFCWVDPSDMSVTSLTPSRAVVPSAVWALPDGGCYVAGAFTAVNSTPAQGLVRLKADGSLDTTFDYSRSGLPAWAAVHGYPLADRRFMLASTTKAYRLLSDGSLDATFNSPTFGYSQDPRLTPLGAGRCLVWDITYGSGLPMILREDGSAEPSFALGGMEMMLTAGLPSPDGGVSLFANGSGQACGSSFSRMLRVGADGLPNPLFTDPLLLLSSQSVAPLHDGHFVAAGPEGCMAVSASGRSVVKAQGAFNWYTLLVPAGDGSTLRLPINYLNKSPEKYNAHLERVSGFALPRDFACLSTLVSAENAADLAADGSLFACVRFVGSRFALIRLKERTAPVVMAEPRSQQVAEGGLVALSYAVDGAADGVVSWYKDGVALGRTGEILVLGDASVSTAGSYSATYRDSGHVLNSQPAQVSVVAGGGFDPYLQDGDMMLQITAGTPLHLEVLVAGSSLTYQWTKDGVDIPGATARVYHVASAALSDAGAYRLKVSSPKGPLSSDIRVYVGTQDAPIISLHPASVSANAGELASLYVECDRPGTYHYQWQKDGVTLNGETAASLNFIPVTAADAGAYKVTISNEYGSVLSNAGTLTVNNNVVPVISAQPQSLRVLPGAAASLQVTAGGTNLVYQWYRNGRAIAAANGPTYALSAAAAGDSAQYSVRVSNSFGTAESAYATLLVSAAASSLSVDPVAVKALALGVGEALALQVHATGSGTLTYQWFRNNVSLAGATSATYSVATVARGDAGSYTCTVGNGSQNVTSDAVAVTVEYPPVILTQPVPLTVAPGARAVLSVSAEGLPAPTFQWYKDSVALSGATLSSITLASASVSDAGQYAVVVRNARGTTTSASAKLTVTSDTVPVSIAPVEVRTLNLAVGARLELHVSVSGVPTPTCQWTKGGVDIPGATTDTLVIPAVVMGDAGSYVCKATNGQSSASSESITVTVGLAQVELSMPFLYQPNSQERTEGDSLQLDAMVNQSQPCMYQWMRDGVALPHANSSSLIIAALQVADSGAYSCRVSAGTTTVESLPALIRVHARTEPPVIVLNPVDRLISFNGGFYFPVASLASYTDVFVPRRNGSAIPLWGVGGSFTVDLPLSIEGGIYDYEVQNSAGSTLSGMALVRHLAQAKSPVISAQPVGVTVAHGRRFEMRVATTGLFGGGYQWYKDGVALGAEVNDSLQRSNVTALDAGDYTVVVTAGTDSVTSQVAHVSVLPQSYAGSYVVNVGTDGNLQLLVHEDNSAVLAGSLPSGLGPVLATGLLVQADGILVSDLRPLGAAADAAALRLETVLTPGGSWSGTLRTASGNVDLAGLKCPATGTVSGKSGLYSLQVPGGTGLATALVAPDGATELVGLDGSETFAAQGLTKADGSLSLTCADARVVTGSLTGTGERAQVSMKNLAGRTRTLAGAVEAKVPVQRLMNVSTRCLSGADNRVLTCGFVVGGTANKLILLRAIGPGLGKFGVSGLLKAPVLQLYNGSTLIGENKGWANDPLADGIAYAASRVGAFDLERSSADSAILVSLPPGSYTAQAKGSGEEGNVLVEVYDLSADTRAQRIMNLSTRAWVGKDDQSLAAGFVVGGQAPRRVLIRATGPTLELFGLPKKDLLAHPKLRLYQGTTLLSETSDWASTPDAALITRASKQVGAFDFATDLEAAMVVALEPGAYSAQIVGADGGTGVAIVEVYELP